MKMRFLTLVLLMFSVSSFGQKTMTYSWVNPEYESTESISKIAFFAITNNRANGVVWEQTMANYFTKKKVAAVAGSSLFPAKSIDWQNPDVEHIKKILLENDIDAAIISAVVDEQTHTQYREGSNQYVYDQYGWFNGSNNNAYDKVYSPGYYEKFSSYLIENNLYEVKDSKQGDENAGHMWLGQSEVEDPKSIDYESKKYSKLLFKVLKKEGLIGKKK